VTQPNRIIGRVAATAKKIVDDSAKVVGEESQKIDGDQYEVKDAIATVTRLVNVGIAGSTELGRILLEERPPETTLALGEYMASVVRRMVSQAGTVAELASEEVERKNYTPNKWLESMTRLIDIAIAGGMEIAETVAAGPAQFERQPVRSEKFTAPESDTAERELSVKEPLKRDATDEEIPEGTITFDPPVLVKPNREFRVLVNATGLVSGVYEGTVNAGTDPVQVQIGL
jgi:hypothetical protein